MNAKINHKHFFCTHLDKTLNKLDSEQNRIEEHWNNKYCKIINSNKRMDFDNKLIYAERVTQKNNNYHYDLYPRLPPTLTYSLIH